MKHFETTLTTFTFQPTEILQRVNSVTHLQNHITYRASCGANNNPLFSIDGSTEELNCLHGIRFLSMTWWVGWIQFLDALASLGFGPVIKREIVSVLKVFLKLFKSLVSVSPASPVSPVFKTFFKTFNCQPCVPLFPCLPRLLYCILQLLELVTTSTWFQVVLFCSLVSKQFLLDPFRGSSL